MNLVSEKHVGCNSNDISCSPEEISDKEADQLHLHESGTESETTLHTDLESLHYEEDSDMFKQHFGSLSNTHKIKSKNTPVRRFSAAYVVHRDYTGDLNKLFSSPIRNRNDKSKNSKDENKTNVISENRSLHQMANEEVKNSPEQDLKNSTQPSEDTIAACKEAFRSLGAAADSAVQAFLELENGSGEEACSGGGAQFLSEAAELLPLIAEKVNAVARLVQHRKNNEGGSRVGSKQRKRKERES
ncbi:unnamed protein product [Lupinus luteus]|uniref:Uncharacterized protein n=1 Tax=Lupinus luteus TaxID=3873 RepID=A0AAV1W0G1_LUPLU